MVGLGLGGQRPVGGRRLVRLYGDGDPDVAAELVRQHLGDEGPQAVLQDVLGELVRGRQQGGVLDESERPGHREPGTVLGWEVARQGLKCSGPHQGKVQTVHVFFPPSSGRR